MSYVDSSGSGAGVHVSEQLRRLREGARPRVLDLFAGCGGLSLGFQRAGYEVVGGVEWSVEAARTHAENFFKESDSDTRERHARPHDITDLAPERFLRDVLGSEDRFGKVDVVAGGPPCQAFARVGRAKLREIGKHPQAFLQDRRAHLYLDFLEYVDFFEPLGVLMENVPDIMNFGGQNVADEIAGSLEELGYTCRYSILNAVHYGVPEMRQRFFLLAVRSELGVVPTFPEPTRRWDLPSGYENARSVALSAIRPSLFDERPTSAYVEPPPAPGGLPVAVSAREAMQDLPAITDHLRGGLAKGARKFDSLACYRTDIEPSAFAMQMRCWRGFESELGVYDHVIRSLPRDYKLFARMKPGDQYPEAYALAMSMLAEEVANVEARTGRLLGHEDPEYLRLHREIVPPYDPGKFPNKWRKMEEAEPARTLTAHIGKDTYSHIHYDSQQARTISVREAARLQSFPDGFRFSGAMNAAFRQIGNAVPPLLAYALANRLRELMMAGAPETNAAGER